MQVLARAIRTAGLTAAAIAALIAFAPARAADEVASSYPNRPIRLIGTFAAGSSVDIIARVVGQRMSEYFHQPVQIDPRPGAGGDIATDLLAKSPKDGYTIGMASPGPLTVNPLLRKSMPYDPIKDLAPIGLIAKGPNALFVNAEVPVRNMAELLAYIKAHPKQVSFASAGVGTSGHVAGELFKSKTGADVQHVAYKGQNEAVTDVVGGRVQLIFSGLPPLLPMVRNGKLKPIAVADYHRSPLMPEVPTVAEVGYPGTESVAWYGMIAPAGVPEAILNRLHEALAAALRHPDTLRQFATLGIEPALNERAEFAQMINTEGQRYQALFKGVGIKPE